MNPVPGSERFHQIFLANATAVDFNFFLKLNYSNKTKLFFRSKPAFDEVNIRDLASLNSGRDPVPDMRSKGPPFHI